MDVALNPYDRIEIIIAGSKLTARPVDFDFGLDGNPIKAIKFESTCPICGQIILFVDKDIIKRGNAKYVGCNNCNNGFFVDNQQNVSDAIVVKQEGQIIEKQQKEFAFDVKVDNPFVDPIEKGEFDPLKVG